MTDIIARRKHLDLELKKAQSAAKRIHLDIKHLQDECEHERAVEGSHQGESCRHCPDCGAHDLCRPG